MWPDGGVDLYALPPEQFTAARDAAVTGAVAQQDRTLATTLKALRKPSIAAWVVNTLIREQAQLLDEVLALGTELAEAQAQGKGADAAGAPAQAGRKAKAGQDISKLEAAALRAAQDASEQSRHALDAARRS